MINIAPKSPELGSNQRHRGLQPPALPLSYRVYGCSFIYTDLEGNTRNRTWVTCSQSRHNTIILYSQTTNGMLYLGIEPRTSAL